MVGCDLVIKMIGKRYKNLKEHTMKQLYKATIKAESNFATPIKGDTLFGQLCWNIRLLEGEKKLKELLKNYENDPFCIVSDALVKDHLPKPKAPTSFLGENADEKKQNRKKQWLEHKDFFARNFINAKKIDEYEKLHIVHNSINYKIGRTEGEQFSPYVVEELSFTHKDIYFLIEESMVETVKKALHLMGIDGFGKDKNIGKGRFSIESFEKYEPPIKKSRYFVALSPFVANGIEAKNIYYDTFVRFGKLGMERAFINPFKKPLVLADRGALIEFKEPKELQFIGRGIKGIATFEDVVHQGYAIVLAIGDDNE